MGIFEERGARRSRESVRWRMGSQGEMVSHGAVIYWSDGRVENDLTRRDERGLRLPHKHADENGERKTESRLVSVA
jgi:hypothetical protein